MKKVGIEEVAHVAGVSTTTVSRVMNGVSTVSEENRRRVNDAIRKLKYRPNPSAQRLAGGKANTVGLIIPRFEGIFHSYYAMQVLQGIGGTAERIRSDLLLHITDGVSFPKGVDGAIFVDIFGCEDLLDRSLDMELPVVILNHYLNELPISCVAIDNKTAAEHVVDYLVKLGHKEIATITGDLKTQAGLDRYDGFVKAIKSHQMQLRDDYIKFADFGLPSARVAAEALFTMSDRPTAVFVASDDMALEAINIAQSKGLRVPEDISIIGFDDNPAAVHARVPLTTVSQPLRKMGSLSLDILSDLMSGKKQNPTKMLLPTELVERQSCRQTWLER